ncbi:MAG: dihydrofolate reductase [Micromonosporaceae bacterium]|nr:dihydrofolate reductase [Micromonosporaceae bacterium]
MSTVTSHMSISLDGYVAGPNQSLQAPLGEGGQRLHEWVVNTAGFRSMHGGSGGESGPDSDVAEAVARDVGAYIMGRKMFGNGARHPAGGAWDESWRGWWGEDPPFHTPVYVLTHQPREPVPMAGGTTFHFVTDGVESALEQARAAAGGQRVMVGGGAATVRQYLAAGLLDEVYLHLVPVLLGAGERLLDGLAGDGAGDPGFEPVQVIASPRVTHIRYRVVPGPGRA